MLATFLSTLAVLLTLQSLLWLVATARRDVSIVDVFWGSGFVIVMWVAAATTGPPTSRTWLLAALVTLWGLRLSLHLFVRRHGRAEDPRYGAMRDKHGRRFWWVSLLTVFWLQAAIIWFVSRPLQATAVLRGERPLAWSDALAGILFAVGFAFESISDWQLATFQKKPANRNQVLNRGLWRYTRHPNYFGDCCVWWSFFLFAAAGGAWWTIASPIVMTILLMKISGVALMESTIQERRPQYAQYIRETNAFLPGRPKKHSI